MTGAIMCFSLHGPDHKMWVTDGDGQSGPTIRHLARGAGDWQSDWTGKAALLARAGRFGRTVYGRFNRKLSFAQVAEAQRFSRMTDSDGRFAQPPT